MSGKRSLVHGVGVNDADYITTWRVDGLKQVCPFISKWMHMLLRCYSSAYAIAHPTYGTCVVCDDWLTFSKFKEWMEKQDWKGKDLDKDLLIPGNKTYSPVYCSFVHQSVNKLLTAHDAGRGKYPLGVSFDKECRKYSATVNVYGKQKKIGRYKTPEEASLAYNRAKAAHVMAVSREQTDLRLRAGLLLHAIDRYYATD